MTVRIMLGIYIYTYICNVRRVRFSDTAEIAYESLVRENHESVMTHASKNEHAAFKTVHDGFHVVAGDANLR